MVFNLYRRYPLQENQPGEADGGTATAEKPDGDSGDNDGQPVIENPRAVLTALESHKAKSAKLQEQLNTLQGQLNDWKTKAESKPDIDPEELKRLRDLEAQVKAKASDAEEEKLKAEQNWEALTAKRVNEVESTYQQKQTLLEEQLASLTSQLEELSNRETTAKSELTEYKMKTAAQALWSSQKINGLSDAFNYAWSDIKPLLTYDDAGQLVLLKEPGSTDLMTDGKGNPIGLDEYLLSLRDQKPFFFNPSNRSQGGGSAPNSAATSTPATRTITKAQAASTTFMRKLAKEIGSDPMAAIRTGTIEVVDND